MQSFSTPSCALSLATFCRSFSTPTCAFSLATFCSHSARPVARSRWPRSVSRSARPVARSRWPRSAVVQQAQLRALPSHVLSVVQHAHLRVFAGHVLQSFSTPSCAFSLATFCSRSARPVARSRWPRSVCRSTLVVVVIIISACHGVSATADFTLPTDVPHTCKHSYNILVKRDHVVTLLPCSIMFMCGS